MHTGEGGYQVRAESERPHSPGLDWPQRSQACAAASPPSLGCFCRAKLRLFCFLFEEVKPLPRLYSVWTHPLHPWFPWSDQTCPVEWEGRVWEGTLDLLEGSAQLPQLLPLPVLVIG